MALTEGVKFSWESFGDSLNALDAMPHSLDFMAMVPHDPLRMLVMGERAEAREAASAQDIAAMREHLRTALAAGRWGFPPAARTTTARPRGMTRRPRLPARPN